MVCQRLYLANNVRTGFSSLTCAMCPCEPGAVTRCDHTGESGTVIAETGAGARR